MKNFFSSRLLWASLPGLLCLSGAAHAATVLSENFQDGTIDGWTTTGTVYANLYSGNYSIGMQGTANARRTISTAGYTGVNISLQMAAHSLEAGETCIADVSINGGTTWTTALTLVNGQDNSALYSASSVPVNADNNANVVVRFRTSVGHTSDYCYGDNIVVTGTASGGGGTPAPDVFEPLSGSGAVSRSLLTYATLISGSDPGSRINLSGYALPANAAEPTNFFQGRLALSNTATGGGFAEIVDTYNYTGTTDNTRKHLPPFDFEFVQTGSHIFPLQRGSIPSTHANWEYVLSPGRAWNENGDNGYTRAAIPFALQQRNANCVHNGVLSFLFKNDGSVSKVAYQIASETCLYFKVDLWGLLPATYNQYLIANAATLKTAYQTEVANRIPVRPLSSIGTYYSGVDAAKLAAPNGTDASHISLVGFYADGYHYTGGCTTRYGTYPYCESLVVPSYSTAKSAFAGVAMMRLEKKYPGTRNAFVSSWVGNCASNGNWNDVTLNNVLDMATGNYGSATYMADEGAAHTSNLFEVDSHASKIGYSCTQYTRKATPGSQWVYHTSDTYIAGTMMNAILKNAEGSTKDLFTDMVVADLWTPLNLSPTAKYTRRTYDSTAQPFVGWGLTWLRDDVAKIGKFIGIDDGVIGGTAQLDTAQLSAAMQRTPSDRGVVPLSDFYYNNGFWALNAQTNLGCSNPAWIPFMSGFGGITVLLLPNDTVYYYFSDNDTYLWMEAAQESAKIRTLCN
ncbi:MAG TPA: hypothetical protein VGE08_00190 [Steroidobacter sp.]|uniref:hypothetical protein n=1 Tax=Steroidobacter sp. TaxID=1978227 RepID=UPI002EDB7AF3